MKTLHNQHLHTSYSRDSQASIDEYMSLANNHQVSYFITTDHIEFDSVYNRQDWTVDYPSLIEDLERLHHKYPSITTLLGVEVGYRKDKLENMYHLLASHSFDLVNMSIHDNGTYDYYMKKDFEELGVDKMLDIYFNNAIDGVETFHDYDILSHIDYGFKTAKMIKNDLSILSYKSYLERIFKQVIKDDKVLEINFKVQETINSINGEKPFTHLKNVLILYKELGGKKISFSSDAHTLDQEIKYYHKQPLYFQVFKELGFNELYYFVKRIPHTYQIGGE